jgi:hypothetical protein
MQDIPPNKIRRFNSIVTVVRNPITRFMSAFAYQHPDNALVTNVTIDNKSKQKYSCFPSLQILLRAGMGHAEIPWNMAHMRYERPLYNDWVKIHDLLSGDGDISNLLNKAPPPPFKENVRNVSSNYHTKDKWTTQTPEERQWLCSLLYDEIRKYIMILSRAINLNDDDLLEALMDVNEKCASMQLTEGS